MSPHYPQTWFLLKKLTQDSNCNVIFNYFFGVFQDKGSERMIGCARKRNGLYHLEALSQSSINEGRLPHSFLFELSLSNKKKIWLHPTVLVIHHFESFKSYSRLCLRVLILKFFIVKCVNFLNTSVYHFQLVIQEAFFLFILFIVIFGDPPLFQMFQGRDGLFHSLMTVLVLLGSSYLNRNLMLVLSYQIFSPWFETNLVFKLSGLGLIMQGIILTRSSALTFKRKE